MDEQKDINRTSLNTKENYGVTVDYGGIVIVHKRTERIVAALFLVTEYLTDSNPIRHKVRHLGVDLMSFILSNQNNRTDTDGPSFVRIYGHRLLEIASLLEVAFLSEQISEMNFRVLGSEIERLVTLVEKVKKQAESLPETSRVSKVFLRDVNSKTGAEPSLSGKLRQKVFGKGQSHSTTKRRFDYSKNVHQNRTIKTDPVSGFSDKKNRKANIISLFSGDKKMSIKDISIVLNDVSEKTIQRELADLVSSGVLNKEGERRWSRYSLKNNPSEPKLS